MAPEHDHQYQGYPPNASMLTCVVPGCNTMTRIDDLLKRTERRGVERGRYDICKDLLEPVAMLTPRGRKAVHAYLRVNPIAHTTEVVKARQARLIPLTIKAKGQ